MPTGRRGTPGELTREIAGIINRELRSSGRTQFSVADQIGVSQSQLSKMLRGEKHIDVDQLAALCAALELNVVAVLREAEEVAATRQRLRTAPGEERKGLGRTA